MIKKILWLYTGGTIACADINGRGLIPAENSGLISNRLDLLPKNINVTTRTLFSLDSTNIEPKHWQQIANAVFEAYSEFDGFVITHGTDTMQYTSAALTLMLKNLNKPVILTGSQKTFKDTESDAPFNFISAFLCAEKIERGVFVCFNGRIISGESAFKLHSRKTDAFIDVNGDYGAITVNKNEYSFTFFKETKIVNGDFELCDNLCEDVFYLKITPGIKPDIIDYIKDNGYRGVICEAYGLGGIPESLLSKLGKLKISGVRVVVSSQCVYGGTDLDIYNVGILAKEAGLETAGNVTGSYALIKLMWELADN